MTTAEIEKDTHKIIALQQPVAQDSAYALQVVLHVSTTWSALLTTRFRSGPSLCAIKTTTKKVRRLRVRPAWRAENDQLHQS